MIIEAANNEFGTSVLRIWDRANQEIVKKYKKNELIANLMTREETRKIVDNIRRETTFKEKNIGIMAEKYFLFGDQDKRLFLKFYFEYEIDGRKKRKTGYSE